MRKLSATSVLAVVTPLLFTGSSGAVASSALGAANVTAHYAAPPSSAIGPASLPLIFQRNQGQAAGAVRYLGQSAGVTVLFTSAGVTLDLAGGHATSRGAARERITLAFLHANPHPSISGAERQPGIVNYFVGNNRARWHASIRTFAEVVYHDLWPGVDAGFTARDGTLKYWFTLAAGARVSEIRLAYTGARRLLIERSGALAIGTAAGVLRDRAPASTQLAAGRRSAIASRYRLLGGTRLGFAIGHRAPGAPVTIDPGLDYGTYLGGSVAEDAFSLDADAAGDLFVFGQTESPDFPTTSGAYQRTMTAKNGGVFFITKLNPSGTGLIYSTFVGGTGSQTASHGAVDSAGDAYVAGTTFGSPSFPITRDAYRAVPYMSNSQSVVFKLNPAGSRLLYSTYLYPDPANGGDSQQIAVVPDGSVIVGGNTDVDFAPTTLGAFERTYPGGTEAGYVARLNPSGSGLVYGTYLGAPLTNQASLTGTNTAVCHVEGLTANTHGSAYIAAGCMPRFPTTPGAYQATARHAGAALLVKLGPGGRRLDYATYWGQSVNLFAPSEGIGSEWVLPGMSAVAVDKKGDAYVTGDVLGESIPATTGAYQSDCTPNDPTSIEMHPNCGGVAEFSPDGTRLLYSSYFGGNQNQDALSTNPTDIAIDASGRMYVVGFVSDGVIPTTPGALQPTPNPNLVDPYFLAVLGKGTLLYSTYFGGAGLKICSGFFCGIDGSISIAPNPRNRTVFIGGTAEQDMPVSPDAFQPTDDAQINTTWAAKLSLPRFP